MNELTQQLIRKDRPKQRLTHKQCQAIRRRVMGCSTRMSVMGDFMLDFDLATTDNESLIYIARLLIKHGDFVAWRYYVNVTLKGYDVAIKEALKADLERYDAKRVDTLATLQAYQTGLLNEWKQLQAKQETI